MAEWAHTRKHTDKDIVTIQGYPELCSGSFSLLDTALLWQSWGVAAP